MTDYLRPITLEQALPLLSQQRVVVAGATDVYPTITQRRAWGQSAPEQWLDISALDELRNISNNGDHWRIGALTTWSDLLNHSLPPAFHGLCAAACQVGGVQIQNRATLGGNLCNASPAADSVPSLLSLKASVELASNGDTRVLPLEHFIKGNRETALKPNELLTAILVPDPGDSRSGFYKLGAREYLVISIVMASVNLSLEQLDSSDVRNTKIRECRLAVGACSAVARRLENLETSMNGMTIHDALVEASDADYYQVLSPIDDIRATAEYRQRVAGETVVRAIQHCVRDLSVPVEART